MTLDGGRRRAVAPAGPPVPPGPDGRRPVVRRSAPLHAGRPAFPRPPAVPRIFPRRHRPRRRRLAPDRLDRPGRQAAASADGARPARLHHQREDRRRCKSHDPAASPLPMPHVPTQHCCTGRTRWSRGRVPASAAPLRSAWRSAGADVVVNYVSSSPEAAVAGRRRNRARRAAARSRCGPTSPTKTRCRRCSRRRQGVRHTGHPGQQRRPAAGRADRRHVAGRTGTLLSRQPDRPVPVRPGGGTRVQAARHWPDVSCCRRQDHLHEFRARGDPLGRARQLRSQSKGGVDADDEELAQELAPERIRVNSICPGAIRTPINRDAWEHAGGHDQAAEADSLQAHRRAGRYRPQAAVWLASDAPTTHGVTCSSTAA